MMQKAMVAIMLLSLTVTSLFWIATPALAQCAADDYACQAIDAANGDEASGKIDLGTSFGFKTIGQALNTVISVIFLVAGLAAFVYILLGAFNYLTAGDDTGKTDKARKMITNAVVGLILVALVYVIWLVAVNLIPGMSNFFKPSDGS